MLRFTRIRRECQAVDRGRKRFVASLLILLSAGVVAALAEDERPRIPLPPPFQSTPSESAKEHKYKENKDFTGPKVDYKQPGYVGDANERKTALTREAAGKITAACDTLMILHEGATKRVEDCNGPADYAPLCNQTFDDARKDCDNICNRAPICKNPVLRPHIYEEWGCGLPPLASIQYCQLYEGCTCTRSPD